MDLYEELCRLAHSWEDQARACDAVRYFGLGDDSEKNALLNRSKVFEACSKSLRSLAERVKEIPACSPSAKKNK